MYLVKWILSVGMFATVSNCQSYENVTNLRSSLLASYNSDVLPLNDHSGVLNINLTMSVFSISEVDPIRGAVTMAISLIGEWYDERLTWTPGDHGGITTMYIQSKEIWTPPLTVANPVKFTILDKSWMQVSVFSDGKATYMVGELIEFTCPFYMKFWPFDKHVCTLSIAAFGYPMNRVTLSVPGTVANTDFYIKNGEWTFEKDSVGYNIDNSVGITQVIYSFKIARQPSFYLLTVILPINGIGALTCLVFLLPSESGERVSYSITIMLSLAVFLTVTAEDLPKSSEPIPIMCSYILFNMIVCIAGLVLVILNLALYHRRENIPISAMYMSLVTLSRCRCNRNKIRAERKESQRSQSEINSKQSFNKKSKEMLESENISVFPQDLISGDKCSTIHSENGLAWKDVSEAIDKLLFYMMVVVTYIPAIIILIYIAAASDYVVQQSL